MIGRRPKRSDKTPSNGEKKNCISAKTTANRPLHFAVSVITPPRKSRISFGKTGMIKPIASTSRVTVTRMKMIAAWRDLIRSTTVEAAVSAAIMMTPLSYRSPKTEVRESKIHGRGLFAKADIAKDEIVAVKGGHIVDRETLRREITFVAMRDIPAGEELTHDWAMTDDDDYSVECNCGARNCRKTLSGKDWQRPELQKKYAGYFSAYLARKIAGET